MKNKKLAVLKSVISLLLCVSMLAGTTFAWFTDGVRSGKNTIVAGNLDVELEYLTADGTWLPVQEDTNVFEENTLWEPGHTEVVYLRVSNAGSLALKYQLGVNIAAESGSVNVKGEEFLLSDHIEFAAIEDVEAAYADRAAARAAVQNAAILSTGYTKDGQLLPGDPAKYVAFVVYMPETVANEANYRTGELPPRIELGISLFATQFTHEADSFGDNYDYAAGFPDGDISLSGKTDITTENGMTSAAATITAGAATADVPAGVQVNEGATALELSVNKLSATGSNITAATNEDLLPVDVHVEGVSATNTTPVKVRLAGLAPIGLNMGNLKLYHVENGTTNPMTRVATEAELTAHNQFFYDPATGDVILSMATFSEVTLLADNDNAWNGEFDYDWYSASKTELTIANADQLAAFGAIVGGMKKVTGKDVNGANTYAEEVVKDSFSGKTIKLISGINIGDTSSENKLVFYPIGYYNSTGKYEKTSGGSVNSNVSSFKGTFDGNGHTIKNFYQNTWEMFGDYNDGYSGTPNHYKDAMGLFGYVNGGTVKNLTVDHFSSDGEYTPTGVIAAYAVNSTFENIAITNCNPRVYNTGNGGIVGIGGNSDDPDTYKLTFNNITIDKTNKITALWGSWDVACGGLVGMFRGAGHVYMTNCHVAAQIDVYNDVCGNYQYYWYRYSGMMVGTNKNMVTDDDGYTVPETSKYHAEKCTVHFGDWNDYYYCELVANSLASYTHDHQFSRLTQIQNVSEIQDANGNWKTTGNFILMNGKTPTNTCYHIMKDANGNLYEHEHNVADATNPEVNEVVNGETVLKENNQRIYLPFNQLFTGYGWGVKHIPVYNGEDYAFEGITILDRTFGTGSIDKFVSAGVEKVSVGQTLKVGELFHAVEGKEADIKANTLNVFVSPVGTDSTAGGTFTIDENDWTQGKVKFTGRGAAEVTITDYYFCNPITIQIDVVEAGFTYRVGNQNAVNKKTLSVMLTGKESDDVTVGVTREAMTLAESDTVKFDGLGIQNVVIDGAAYSVEVVDAINSETAASATNNNIVLLKDCGFSSLEVSSGYTLYGNGFTMTCGSDSAALDMGYAFVTLNSGILDNVQIVCPNFDYAVLYKSNMTESGNRSETTDRKRYFNVKSGVMVSGNSQILNSRISGARAAVNVAGGNCVIDNSRIELGAVASILVGSANSLTLRDVTLVQKPTASTYDPSKTLMGLSVLVMCSAGGVAAPITLEGTLIQNAWVSEKDKGYIPSDAQGVAEEVLKKTEYLHDLDGDGEPESLNLGIAYMPEDDEYSVGRPNITDKRTNSESINYESVGIRYTMKDTYVFSYKSTNGTDDAFKTETDYEPNKYGDIITVTYSDTTDGLESGKSFGTSGWVYELNVDLDKASEYKLDFSKLSMSVNGTTVTDFKVDGNAKPASPVAVTAGGTTYTLTATIDGKEYTATYKVTGTETSKESPTLVAANYEAGLCVASSYGGTWHGAAPALQGIQIKYWSVAEKQYKTINLADYTPTTKGQQNGTNTTWTYSPANGDFTLTLTGGQVHSSNNVYAMPVVCDGKLYFVAANSKGLVNSGNSARTIPVSYTFKDNNGGDVLTFSHTWSVAENKDAQYKYSDFCNGTKTKLENCVTPDTLITLANGKQVRVDSLKGNEQLLVWNMETGKLDSAPIMFVDSEPEAEFEIVHLYFSDGSEVKVIGEHGFWDYDLNRYVYLDRNAVNYLGHTFAKQDGNKLTKVKLTQVTIKTEETTAWSPVTAGHLCYFVNGMLSMPGGVGGLFNIFDVDPATMTYDYAAMERDIAKYGLFTYEELNAIAPLSRKMFEAAGGAYLKVSIGKGNLTMDELVYMINRYSKFFN